MFELTLKRALLALTAAGALAAGPASAAASGDPIKIGGLYILSGSAATYGKFAEQGIQLAMDEINAQGGVLGRPLALLMEDDQGKAAVGIQAARKLVYQDKVQALVGVDSSGVALGLVPTMKELRTPLILTHAATPHATGKLCNDYTFRISVNEEQNMRAAAELAAKTGAKRWTTIGPDYAFGHEVWEYFGKYLKKFNPDAELMKETAFPRFGAEDFTPFINGVMQNKPDGVIISVWGGDLVNFVRQANNLGFFNQGFQLMFAVGAATEVLTALGPQMPEGVWLGTRYWYAGYDSPRNEQFVDAFKKKYGVPPSYNAEGAYASIYAVKAAIEKGGKADAESIAKALQGLTLETPTGQLTLRKGDNQALIGPTWGRTGPMNDADKIRSLVDAKTFTGAEVTPALEDTGCKAS